ncbi:sugar porter family MFS transporter [Streptomyces griseoviridis]|uniref:Sugar transporter n=1 Tax=Streptomyces griseoviridis TaxID=45398 RepID=A0A918LJ56_STRGD|nr:sugar porter family MFS transporter [Streptomyces niveoruber]GGS55464.1 sugar transporter [Streptomyces niveoruber]
MVSSPPPPVTAAAPPAPRLGRVTFIAAVAALGGFLFGYDSAVINGAVTGIQHHFGVGAGRTGTIVAVALLGSALGAAVAGRLAERVGRLRVMRMAAVLFAVSAVGSALPFSAWDLGAWRFVGGIAIGLASLIGPTYIAEVAPPEYRGRLASFQQAAIVLGITASQLVNWAIAQGADGRSEGALGPLGAWQWMLLAAFVPAVLYFVLSTRIPESPHHLVARGRLAEAGRAVRDIEGPGSDADARLAEIARSLRDTHKPRVRDLFGGRAGLLPVVWAGIGLAVFQQLVGINVIFYYSSVLWQSVGIDQSGSLLISLSTSIVNIVGTVVAMLLIDRVGRRPLALAGSLGMAVSLALAAWAFSGTTGSGDDIGLPDLQAGVALVAAHTFVFFFAASWGVVLWVMVGEMFPLRIRAAAISVATAFNWIANWAVSESFPALSEWNLSAGYVIYAAFALVSAFFVAFAVTETKGTRLGGG